LKWRKDYYVERQTIPLVLRVFESWLHNPSATKDDHGAQLQIFILHETSYKGMYVIQACNQGGKPDNFSPDIVKNISKTPKTFLVVRCKTTSYDHFPQKIFIWLRT